MHNKINGPFVLIGFGDKLIWIKLISIYSVFNLQDLSVFLKTRLKTSKILILKYFYDRTKYLLFFTMKLQLLNTLLIRSTFQISYLPDLGKTWSTKSLVQSYLVGVTAITEIKLCFIDCSIYLNATIFNSCKMISVWFTLIDKKFSH